MRITPNPQINFGSTFSAEIIVHGGNGEDTRELFLASVEQALYNPKPDTVELTEKKALTIPSDALIGDYSGRLVDDNRVEVTVLDERDPEMRDVFSAALIATCGQTGKPVLLNDFTQHD